MPPKPAKPSLVVDVSPLWELQYTGISNVVLELARRFLGDENPVFDVHYSVFHQMVPRSLVEQCVAGCNGAPLKRLFETAPPPTVQSWLANRSGTTVGLHLHRKPPERIFDFESQLYYDLSFLSVPECHTAETIDYHTRDLASQIATTDQFFTISEATARDLNFYFQVDPAMVEVAYLGPHVVDEGFRALSDQLSDRKVEKFLLCLGTIEPRKNVRILLAWLQQNVDVMDVYRFVFVGRDGWGQSFGDLLREYDLQDYATAGRITHLGYISEAQKNALMLSASGLIYPSLFEGFGLPVLEAMELGIPIASSCSTSLPEVLGPDGIYFDPYSVESLDVAMGTLIIEQLTGQYRARSAALRERAAEFTYDRCFEVIMTALRDKYLLPAKPEKPSRTATKKPSRKTANA